MQLSSFYQLNAIFYKTRVVFRKTFHSLIIDIIKMIKKLSNLVISILSVNTEQKIHQRLGMMEKYKIDDTFYM